MPTPLEEAKISSFADKLVGQLGQNVSPVVGMLTADDAVARAVAYNNNVRRQELEATLADAKARAQSFDMLPGLLAESNYYGRNLPAISRSNLSPTYSTSSDPTTLTQDMTLSWNILDFGLSYVRSEQALDKAHQQLEEVRRVRGKIVEETLAAYWRAVAFEQLDPSLARLAPEITAALELAQQASKDPTIDPASAFDYQRDILNLQRELNQIHASLAGAVYQLKVEIGATGNGYLRLQNRSESRHLRPMANRVDDDIGLALRQRPEIRQVMYDMRITQAEVDATILQLLPGVRFEAAISSDTTSYLKYGNWADWGSKVSGNLVRLFRASSDLDVVDIQQDANRQSALATASAIAMQVHIARARMAIAWRTYHDAERFSAVQLELLKHVKASVKLGNLGQEALVKEKLATLLADIHAILSLGDLNTAYAAYDSSIGNDVIQSPVDSWTAAVEQPDMTFASTSPVATVGAQ